MGTTTLYPFSVPTGTYLDGCGRQIYVWMHEKYKEDYYFEGLDNAQAVAELRNLYNKLNEVESALLSNKDYTPRECSKLSRRQEACYNNAKHHAENGKASWVLYEILDAIENAAPDERYNDTWEETEWAVTARKQGLLGECFAPLSVFEIETFKEAILTLIDTVLASESVDTTTESEE